VDNRRCHVLRAGTELKHRQKLGEGIDGQPQPEDLCGASQPGSEFVQLQVREVQMAEEALVHDVRVRACTGQPGGNGGLSKAEDPLGSRRIQPFGQRREHYRDLLGRGFQTVQGGVASGTERGAASLAAKCLDALETAMLAISYQGVDMSIGDAEVRTLLVGTSEALRGYALGGSPSAFDLAPGAHGCRGLFHAWRGATTDGAIQWRAGLE
jgi:hypothetical protein